MTIRNGKIPPTITLAQLYEAQQQYFDAFIIYKKIYEQSPNEEILERMTRSKNRIFMDANVIYHDIVKKIFNEEDKELFRILPEENYINYQNSLKSELEETEFTEEDFEEDEYDMTDAEELEQIYNPADLPPFEEFAAEMKAAKEFPVDNAFDLASSLLNNVNGSTAYSNNFTVSDLSKYLLSEIGANRRVKDLTLHEILKIIEMIKKVP